MRSILVLGGTGKTGSELSSAKIGAVAGYDVSHVDPPLNEYLAKCEKAGASAGTVAYYRRVYSNIANGFARVVTGDVERLTGRKPRSFAWFRTGVPVLLDIKPEPSGSTHSPRLINRLV